MKIRNLWLLLASLLFYGWGEPKYIAVMAFSIAFNYVFGRVIGHLRETADQETALPAAEDDAKSLTGDRAGGDENAAGQAYGAVDIAGNGNRKIMQHARLAMVLCVIGNLAILGFFKYTDFLIGTVNGLLGGQLSLLHIALPIGISFYTFQTMSYIIDVYWGKVPAQRDFIAFAAYVTLFPQLIAGPIVRYADVAVMLVGRKTNAEQVAEGIRRFIIGFGKKGCWRIRFMSSGMRLQRWISRRSASRRHGSAHWRSPSKSILIFRVIRIWRSVWARSSVLIIWKTSIIRTFLAALPSSGGVGTCR